MKKVICIFAVLLVAMTVGVAFAVGAPAITPQDFPVDQVPSGSTGTAAAAEAYWIWSVLIGEIAVAVVALFSKVVESIINNIKNARIAKGCRIIYSAVMVAFHEFVRVAKSKNDDGKLTVPEKNEALQYAYRAALDIGRKEGFDLLKVFAKETILALIEKYVGESKAAAVVGPLADLEPSRG